MIGAFVFRLLNHLALLLPPVLLHRRLFAPLLDRIDVVELSAEVMLAAQNHFGLVEVPTF